MHVERHDHPTRLRGAAPLIAAVVLAVLLQVLELRMGAVQARPQGEAPVGAVVTAEHTGPGTVHVEGWAVDPVTAEPVDVALSIDGADAGSVVADQASSAVVEQYPLVDAQHGFSALLEGVAGGEREICATGRGEQGTASVGCVTAELPSDPVGALEAIQDLGDGTARVRGWAVDPDAVDPVLIRITSDGDLLAEVAADQQRTDLPDGLDGWGDAHGLDAVLPLRFGDHEVCITAVNVAGGADAELGCGVLGMEIPQTGPGPFSNGIATSADWAGSRAVAGAERMGRNAVVDELRTLTDQPTTTWLGDYAQGDALDRLVNRQLDHAEATGGTSVFVVYGIPGRDCGLHSSGGLEVQEYHAWIERIAGLLQGRPAAVILEPDALAQLGDCDGQGDRLALLADAGATLAGSGAAVYLDAGHSNWVGAEEMASRLEQAGVERLRGFSTNVSNFYTTEAEQAFAEEIRSITGKDYVIDVSRNGAGPQGEWCNPPGAGLGEDPRAVDDGTGLDALLWIKTPGQSDGTCNGGPAAGEWWEQQALDLIGNRP